MFNKFLDPKNDLAFKRIFGTEKNKDILIPFLNDMLVFKGKSPVVEVTFLKPSQDPEIASKKVSIVDILCKDKIGNSYIVEMQVAKVKGFEKRAQYYASKAYISQINKGEDYPNLKEIIFLAIVDFIMFPNKKAYKSDHIILDKETHDHDLKDFSFTFLELGKFNKMADQLSSVIDKWAYFFKHAPDTSQEDLEKVIGEEGAIQKAFVELSHFAWNDEEFLGYEQAEKHERDYISSLNYSHDEGWEEGLVEGRKEGKEEEKREVALKMIRKGYETGTIVELTGFSLEEIKKLQKKMLVPG